jgi:hypothetical protein
MHDAMSEHYLADNQTQTAISFVCHRHFLNIRRIVALRSEVFPVPSNGMHTVKQPRDHWRFPRANRLFFVAFHLKPVRRLRDDEAANLGLVQDEAAQADEMLPRLRAIIYGRESGSDHNPGDWFKHGCHCSRIE